MLDAGSQVTIPDVLLIEDAWRFRALIKAQLMELGFEVLRLPALEAGVKLLSALDRARPRLVVVDTVGQSEVLRLLPQLRAVAGDIPIVLCTGPYDEETLDFEPEDWAAVLVRPFTIGDLADTVIDILRRPEDPRAKD